MQVRPTQSSGNSAAASAAAFFLLLPLLLLAPARPALADAAAGLQKAQACLACHGEGGRSTNPLYPVLAGQPRQFLVSALFAFREGKRKSEQMAPFAANLTNADLNDLAAYFSTQSATGALRKSSAEVAAAGRALTEKNNCTSCHGPALYGQQHIPRLAGQHMEYLKAQLTGFRASTRADIDGNMTSAAQVLTPQDIEVLADYLSGLGAP